MLLVGLLAASIAASDSRVTNVTLSHSENGTVATIDVTGEARFSHQTEIAKNGKPFRVIVDMLMATHHLGAKVFENVPDCIISSVRTSQYSVKPEKVVRIVFDMKRETAYQIAAVGNTVRITFPDENTPAFASWSSRDGLTGSDNESQKHARGFVPPKRNEKALTAKGPKQEPVETATDRLNKAINDDRMSSLQSSGKSNSSKPPSRLDTAVTHQPPAPPAVGATVDELAEWDSAQLTGTARKYSDRDMHAARENETEDHKPALPPALPDKVATDQGQTKVNSESKPEPVQVSADETKSEVEPVLTNQPPAPRAPSTKVTARADKPELAKKSDDDAGRQAKKPAGQPVRVDAKTGKAVSTEDGKPELAQTNEEPAQSESGEVKEKPPRRSTARFRRSPRMSRKLKGTMVAEFPKRLVIKYKTGGNRDPFATLINEAQVKSGAMEDRIPNVDGLRLVGVIESSQGKNSALFEDSEGYSYILKAGDKVRRGYVLRVEPDRAYFQIFEYGWSRTVALNIED
jgi:hypothetical protein